MIFKAGQVERRAEGSDVIAGVFFTPQPKLGNRVVSLSKVLRVPCRENGMAAVFFCGKEDADASKFAGTLQSNLKVEKSKKHAFIAAVKLETKLSGMKLLQKGLKVENSERKLVPVAEGILEYLDAVVADRGNEGMKHDDAQYIWRHPANPQLMFPAKQKKTEKNLNFDTYDKFISQ
jgi:hypothetical protein